MNTLHRTALASLLLSLTASGFAQPSETDTPESARLAAQTATEQRLAEVERNMAALQRKLRLLGSDEAIWMDGDALWDEPAPLLAYAKKLAGDRRHFEAYHLLALLHARFPESMEDREALRIARGIFGSYYFRTRIREPKGAWAVSEATSLFQWVNHYREADDFPELLGSVLRGLPFSFYDDYLAFNARHYPLDFNWKVAGTIK